MGVTGVQQPLTPLPLRARTTSPAPAAAPAAAAATPTDSRPAGDRFVNGAWAGGLAGMKSTLLAAVPIVLLESDVAKWFVGNIGPGTKTSTIALLTVGAVGTGAIAGGVAASATQSRTWGTVAG